MAKGFGFNKLIFNDKVTWSSGAGQDTPKDIDIPLPDDLQKDGEYQVYIDNPSSESALTVQPQVKWIDVDGNIRYSNLATYSVAQDEDLAKVIKGILMGQGGRLHITNDNAINTDTTVYIQVRKI